jgi:hypothetical protein
MQGNAMTLDELIEMARERGPMTDEERQAQRESWVRGELGMGTDEDERALRQEWRDKNEKKETKKTPAS